MSYQLLVFLVTVGCIFLVVSALGLMILAVAVRYMIEGKLAQRRAKRARIAELEDRYRERVCARHSWPAVTLRLDGRPLIRKHQAR